VRARFIYHARNVLGVSAANPHRGLYTGRVTIPLASTTLTPPPVPTRRGAGLAVVIAVGAFWVVLAGRQSVAFDLDRHLVPKELALHVTSLLSLLLLIPNWRQLRLRIVDLLLLLAGLWAVVSSVLATNPWIATRSVGVLLSGLVLFAAGRSLADSRWKPAVLGALASASVVGGAIGVAQAYGLDLDVLATTRLPGGTFGNRNFMAHLVTLGMPILLLGSTTSRSRGGRLAARLGIVISLTAIVLTRSRAAWLGVAAVMGVMLLGTLAKSWRHALTRRTVRATAIAFLLGLAIAVLVPNRLAWNSDSPYRDSITGLVDASSGSGRGRLIQWRNSLDLVPDAPILGVGPGNWFIHYPRVTTPGDPSFAGWDTIPTNPWPSSDWVAFISEVGIPGTLLLLLAGLAMVITALRRLRTPAADPAVPVIDGPRVDPDRDLADPGESIALMATLAAAAVMGTFDAVLHLAAPTLFVFTIAGLLVPVSGVVIEWVPGKRTRRLLVGGSVLAMIVLVSMSLGHDRTIRVTQADRSLTAFRAALRFDPTNFRLHLRLAMNGPCTARLRHARIARTLLPYHQAPRDALRACGQSS